MIALGAYEILENAKIVQFLHMEAPCLQPGFKHRNIGVSDKC